MLKDVGVVLSKFFFFLFISIFSPIWRDCILKGEERKLVGSTTFLSPSPSQPNGEKCHFHLIFFFLFFILFVFTPTKRTLKGENFPINKKRLDINYIDHDQRKGNNGDIALLKGTQTKKHT